MCTWQRKLATDASWLFVVIREFNSYAPLSRICGKAV